MKSPLKKVFCKQTLNKFMLIMKSVCTIFLLSFFFISCKKEINKTPNKSMTDELIMVPKSFSDTAPKNCSGSYNCSEISIETLIIEEKSTIADSINGTILKNISDCLSTQEKPITFKNYDEIVKNFLANYVKNKQELTREFPNDSAMAWSASAQTKIEFQSKNLLNIAVNYDIFTGGAHGYGAVISLLFDTKTGKIIPQNKLFSDVKKATEIAEIKFKENQKLDAKTTLDEAGYFFENGIFKLSQNILFSKNGITLHYNQYEAASYAQGPIIVTIPYSEIEKYLLIK